MRCITQVDCLEVAMWTQYCSFLMPPLLFVFLGWTAEGNNWQGAGDGGSLWTSVWLCFGQCGPGQGLCWVTGRD